MAIPNLHARTAASNAHGGMHGLALQAKQKSVQNTDLNIPAPARGMPVAPEKPVAENIPHALVLLLIFGVMVAVLVVARINILAPALAKAHREPPVAENTKVVAALVAINGIMVRALILVLHLMYGMVAVVFAAAPINIAVIVHMRKEEMVQVVMVNMKLVYVQMNICGVILLQGLDVLILKQKVGILLVNVGFNFQLCSLPL